MVFVAAGALLAGVFAGSAPAAEKPRGLWFTSWAQSQQGPATAALTNQSMRMITHLSQGGDAVRIRVQNTFGQTPLTVDSATAGIGGANASVAGARPVTFG